MRALLLCSVFIAFVSGQDDGCPIDFIQHGESCYHFFDYPLLSWWDAMAFCGIYGSGEGTLATVESADEQTFLENELKTRFPNAQGRDYWLGGYDIVNENTWVWVKKNEYINEYTHWGPGEPNGNRNENCLALYDGLDFNWNDAPCHLEEAFICEVPLGEIGAVNVVG